MENIEVIEHTNGYPFVLPSKSCPEDEFEKFVHKLLRRKDLISPAIQLNSAFHGSGFHSFLRNMGFKLSEEEYGYELELSSKMSLPEFPAQYGFRKYCDTGLAPFLQVASNVSQIQRLKTEEAMRDLQTKTFNPGLWEVVCFEKEPIGFILCDIDSSGVGRILYIAVANDFQNKGIGKELHRKALVLLREYGAKIYRGGTDSGNIPMLRIFKSNGCKQLCVNCIYTLKFPALPGCRA